MGFGNVYDSFKENYLDSKIKEHYLNPENFYKFVYKLFKSYIRMEKAKGFKTILNLFKNKIRGNFE
jgi:hypothetical protein